MKYVLGLDVGITSIGWAIYDMESATIEKCGVRLFDAAEHPKDKSSLAEPRRIARGQRRRIRRRAYRMKSIKELLIKFGLITEDNLNSLFDSNEKGNEDKYNVYFLRNKALTQKLTNMELSQVLIHLAKHRGFKSNRKKDKSLDGKVNVSLKENRALLQNGGYETVGQMLYLDQRYFEKKRNSSGEYNIMLQREDILAEAKLIFRRQKSFGMDVINEDLINSYTEIFSWQKSFDWRGNIQDMVGSCQFEKNEKRAPKACFSSEKFIALSKLNNIYYSYDDQDIRLDSDQIKIILEKAMSKKSGLNYYDIKKALCLPELSKFNMVKYNANEDFLTSEKNTKIKELQLTAYHELHSAISSKCGEITWNNLFLQYQLLDEICVELTYNKNDEDIRGALNKLFENNTTSTFTTDEKRNIIDSIIDNGVAFDKNINISLKALYKIVPFLETGHRYDEACKLAEYHHSQHNVNRYKRLPSIQELGLDEELTNPVVTRAISQLRKVVNAVIKQYGSPYQINVELARDVGKSAKKRNEIDKKNKDSNALNERLKQDFCELNPRNAFPRGDEFIKFKLWKQQGERCIYSGDYIHFEELLNGSNATQVDHAIPYSRSYNDSLMNKVLCFTKENQQKANKTPFEYIYNDKGEQAWHLFTERCHDMNKTGYQLGFTYNKHDLLLLKKFDQEGFISRNLNDTRYIARFCHNYFSNYLEFADKNNKKPVRALTGQETAFIRKNWGLNKSRDENDLHHAQDACVISSVTDKLLRRVGEYMRARDYGKTPDLTYTDPETGEIFSHFPLPKDDFRDNIIQKVSEVFISRMPNRKVAGSVHDETIRSRKYYDNPKDEYNNGEKFSTVNKSLVGSGLKLDKDGEIEGLCPTYKLHNINIYQLLQQRLEDNGNDCKKAFSEPLFAPRRDGTPSDIQIKTIKTMKVQNTGVNINHGIVDNGGMVRVDIFIKAGKNYIVPIYQSDVVKENLPNKAIVAATDENEWTEMDDSYNYLFSLYSKDLIKVTNKKGDLFGYYIGTDRATSGISILHPNGSKTDRIGIKVNTIIEKYEIDVLGNYVKIEKETRQNFKEIKK